MSSSIHYYSLGFKFKNLCTSYFLSCELHTVLQEKEFILFFVPEEAVGTNPDTSDVWHPSRNFIRNYGNSIVQCNKYYCCHVITR